MKKALTIALMTTLVASAVAYGYDRPGEREKARERMEILRMWKMMEALDLDKATADKIYAIRRKFLDERAALQSELRTDFAELRRALHESRNRPDDDTDLKRLLDSIKEKRARLRGFWLEQYDEISKVLSVRQRAELMVFLKDFHREIRSIVNPHRSEGPPRPEPHLRAPAPPPPRGPLGPPRGRSSGEFQAPPAPGMIPPEPGMGPMEPEGESHSRFRPPGPSHRPVHGEYRESAPHGRLSAGWDEFGDPDTP